MFNRMSKVLVCFIGLCVVAACASTNVFNDSLEVRISQKDYIFAHVARKTGNGYEGANAYYDMVLPNIALVNKGSKQVVIEEAWIESKAGKQVLQRTNIRMD